MKRFNKILAVFLAVVMIAGLMVIGVSATETADKVIYREGFEIGDTFTALPAGELQYSVQYDENNNQVKKAYWNGAEPKNTTNTSLAWAQGNKSLVEVIDGAGRDGGDCIKYTSVEAGVQQRVNIIVKGISDLHEDGKQYVASVWVKIDVDETATKPTAYGGIRATKTAATNNPNLGPSKSADTDWYKIEVPYTYEADNSGSFLFNLNLSATDAVMYLDDFQIVERSISVGGSNTVAIDKTVDLSADVTQEYSALVWSTEDTDVVSVDAETGAVTGIKEGTATIKATATVLVWDDTNKKLDDTENISAEYTVTVVDGVVHNTTVDGYYKTLVDAMAAASNGNMIKLIGDAEETAGVMIPAGVTLDLAGKTLTVPSLAALKGANVIDSVGGGKLAVAESNLMLQKDNSAMPVKVEGGYVFTNIYNNTAFADTNDAANGVLGFKFKPKDAQNISDDFANYMKAADEHGLTVKVRMVWTNSQSAETVQEYTCGDSYVAVAYADGTACTITVNGVDGLDDLTVYCVLVSDTGVENVSAGLAYTAAT